MKKILRFFKGMYMGVMFLTFWVLVLFGGLVVAPCMALCNFFFGLKPDAMQTAFRTFFSLWLGLVRLGGLFSAPRFKGELPQGPFVIVANHPGWFDILVLVRDIPKMTVLVKKKLTTFMPLGRLLSLASYVTVGEESSFGSLRTLKRTLEVIDNGYSFMIFPEGTRSPKGELRKFKPGAFKLALKANVPVLPILIRNHPPFYPKEDPMLLPSFQVSRFRMEIWDPIPPPESGQLAQATADLENRYRVALGLETGKSNITAEGS